MLAYILRVCFSHRQAVANLLEPRHIHLGMTLLAGGHVYAELVNPHNYRVESHW